MSDPSVTVMGGCGCNMHASDYRRDAALEMLKEFELLALNCTVWREGSNTGETDL